MPQKICNFCKEEYHAKRSVQKYCSTKCQTDSLVQVPVMQTCKREECENEFNVGRQKNPKKYCSSSCAATVNNTLAPKRLLEGSCKKCNESISSSLVFCAKCREKNENKIVKKKLNKLLDLFCKECGKEFHQKSTNQKFCSTTCGNSYRNSSYISCLNTTCIAIVSVNSKTGYCAKCYTEFVKTKKIQSWLDGSWSGGSERTLSPTVRFHLLEEANYTCSTVGCGFNTPHPSDGKTVLEVDHIDGNGGNHVPSNLRVLCPNCHALTPSYRGRNVGFGRKVYYLRVSV